MPRYIDADLLYKETEKRIAEANDYRMAVVDDDFLDLINDAYTEDVVEVVRCKKTIDWAFIANGTRYKFSSIGKTVFLTREDAEQALKAVSDG